MARFLSAAWFADLDRERVVPAEPSDPAPACVIRHVVTGGPDGEVRYRVVWESGGPRVRRGDDSHADVTFTSDYPTAAAIARGELSAEVALLEGRVRVSGHVAQASPSLRRVAGHDLLPATLRAATTA